MKSPLRGPANVTEGLVGFLASAGAVVLVSAAIAVLDRWIPVLSLGVLYILAVMPVAVLWGLALASAVSVASMLAFNWFFLPPTHTFQLRDGANWAVLAVYLSTAVVVSALAARARRRRTRGGGARGGGAAAQRLAEDVAPARGLARPPLAADRDRRRRIEPLESAGHARRRRSRRARRDDPRRGRAARPARRQPPRPVAAPRRRSRTAPGALARGRARRAGARVARQARRPRPRHVRGRPAGRGGRR